MIENILQIVGRHFTITFQRSMLIVLSIKLACISEVRTSYTFTMLCAIKDVIVNRKLNFYSLFSHGFFRYKIVSTDCGNYYYFLRPSGNQIFLVCVLCRKLHQQFEMYKEQVKKMGEESQQQQEQKGDAPTCGICHKTKFADGCGHNCSYCQTKFCARCGGRVSLRSNKVQDES